VADDRVLLIAPEVTARRVRVLMEYSGMSAAGLAQKSGVSLYILNRIIARDAKDGPRGASLDELTLLANAADVPNWFVEDGFDGHADDPLTERVAALEEAVSAVIRRVGEPFAYPPGALERWTQDSPPSDGRRGQRRNRLAEDRKQGSDG
jgi:hypothetical protein